MRSSKQYGFGLNSGIMEGGHHMVPGRSQSPIDFGSHSAIRGGDNSPDNLLMSRDTSLLNFNSNMSNFSKQPKH
jgi:hypothetical protein